ncbi:hypothetical protein GJAV_G00242060 [Gymnothorax javanicus]|nr:hypothetical protein GJAV_G00242060 [Gymnothorax javanicus]
MFQNANHIALGKIIHFFLRMNRATAACWMFILLSAFFCETVISKGGRGARGVPRAAVPVLRAPGLKRRAATVRPRQGLPWPPQLEPLLEWLLALGTDLRSIAPTTARRGWLAMKRTGTGRTEPSTATEHRAPIRTGPPFCPSSQYSVL